MLAEVKSIGVPKPLACLGERFREAGRELYLVGGFVRDALSGSPGNDVDATSGARPDEIKQLLRPVADHLWMVGERFGTIAAKARTGEIHDPFDGRRDLESGVIRPVGDPLDRMRDDPLRMLRAVRFETVLTTPEKPFGMTPDLESAIEENAHWLRSV